MEILFTTELFVGQENVVYQLHFANEKYTFLPAAEDKAPDSFSLKRAHDEWHELEPLSPQLKDQAISALENYLLAQH